MAYSLRKTVRDTTIQYASSRKRIKIKTPLNDASRNSPDESDKSPTECPFCDQQEDEVKLVSQESSAICERSALYLWIYNDKLKLSDLDETEKHPVMSITNYAVYDRKKHLCPIDAKYYDDIEEWIVSLKGCVLLTARSGETLKKQIKKGKIQAESYTAFDVYKQPGAESVQLTQILRKQKYIREDEDQLRVVLSSTLVDYTLMDVDTDYSDLMRKFLDKILVTRATIVYLLKNYSHQPTYEGLIAAVSESPSIMADCINLTKEIFHKHLHFICEQIQNHQRTNEKTPPLLSIPFMQSLMSEFNISLTKNTENRNIKGIFPMTKATTTFLVRKTFEDIFSDHLADDDTAKVDNTSRSVKNKTNQVSTILLPFTDSLLLSSMVGEQIYSEKMNIYYSSIVIKEKSFKCEDFIEFGMNPADELCVGKIAYIWVDTNEKKIYFHVQIFIKGYDTILGDIAEPREIYLTNKCIKVSICFVSQRLNVIKKVIPDDWSKLGDKCGEDLKVNNSETSYFYQKQYDEATARFDDIPEELSISIRSNKHKYCISCYNKSVKFISNIPSVTGVDHKYVGNYRECSSLKWKGSEYKNGDSVFLAPSTFRFNHGVSKTVIDKKIEKDESIFTEYYRYNDDSTACLNSNTREPFCVGYISAILAKGRELLVDPQNIYLELFVMYRPENTSLPDPHTEDLNLVYWSDRKEIIHFSKVTGLCDLAFINNITSWTTIEEWSRRGGARFYFKNCYDVESRTLLNVPQIRLTVGESIKSKHHNQETVNPLRGLDIFAGCGGLSKGLHDSGTVRKSWAVELDPSAAAAYQLNMPDSVVFTEDCNIFLKHVMKGDTFSSDGKPLPKPGDVEIMCGGPPCQGFSGMNRFTTEENATFKNSLIVTYLSYCDFYRPKYIIMENVRNFAFYNKGVILKLTLNCLLKIGYQCTFGILQAGNFGVPQTRRRFILFAAAPGFKLPYLPEPTHVFSRKACWLSVTVDNKRFDSPCEWEISAPRRTCTIRDAISDLPIIANGSSEVVMDYKNPPNSHIQRLARSHHNSNELRDHICKHMGPMMYARICHIPINSKADWRDIPNVEQILSDGTKCKKLIYTHTLKNDRGVNVLKGVCACAAGKLCRAEDKQNNTLIPWFLPHSANRTNNWSGVCGRLTWDGYFSTTITNPEPLGKQGRVLHPTQQRVVSVRECARSQGFPDSFYFVGDISEKHQQIGNAVPPTLAAALGQEIYKFLKCFNMTE